MTQAQINRTRRDWEAVSEETVTVEEIGGTLYGLCSKMAALVLFHHYNRVTRTENTNAGFSTNLNSWYFSLTPKY